MLKKLTIHKLLILLGLVAFCFIIAFAITSCNRQKKGKQAAITTITVSTKSVTKTLHFLGIIEPIVRIPISAPFEGVINKLFFEFGSPIKKGQTLLTVRSDKLKTNFQSAFADYLKTKQNITTSQAKLQSTKKLFEKGLVSKDDMDEAKKTYFNDRLAFIQSTESFKETLKFRPIKDIEKLSIADIDVIYDVLQKHKLIEKNVIAPKSGTALFLKKDDKDENKIKQGFQTKKDQILFYIGDMSGILIKIKVNQIKAGGKVSITSPAFPNILLNGYIKSIDAQATVNGTSSFSAKIVIPKITEKQQKIIRAGMSANIALKILHKPLILIPIEAVSYKQGHNVVKILEKGTNTTKDTLVTIGETTLDSVIITSGLKDGDQIVVPN